MKILMDHTNEGIAKRFDDITHTELTERGTFYVITRKDNSRLYISTNTILWFNETPEEGDDDLFS
jgi:hypothetical protein